MARAGTRRSAPRCRNASGLVVRPVTPRRPWNSGRGARNDGRRNGSETASVETAAQQGRSSDGRVARRSGAEQEERAREVPRIGREERGEERRVEEEAGPAGEPAGERREREKEGQGHRVRVEVPEPEREEGPLGDRVRDAPRRRPEVDGPERRPREELARAVERPREGEEERRRDGRRRALHLGAGRPRTPPRPPAPRRAPRSGCRRTPAGPTRGGTAARGRRCRSGSTETALPRTTGRPAGAGTSTRRPERTAKSIGFSVPRTSGQPRRSQRYAREQTEEDEAGNENVDESGGAGRDGGARREARASNPRPQRTSSATATAPPSARIATNGMRPNIVRSHPGNARRRRPTGRPSAIAPSRIPSCVVVPAAHAQEDGSAGRPEADEQHGQEDRGRGAHETR